MISARTSAAKYADRAAQWAAIALGFSIPLSVALDNVLLLVVPAGWLATAEETFLDTPILRADFEGAR